MRKERSKVYVIRSNGPLEYFYSFRRGWTYYLKWTKEFDTADAAKAEIVCLEIANPDLRFNVFEVGPYNHLIGVY